jgi:hypothetical protein
MNAPTSLAPTAKGVDKRSGEISDTGNMTASVIILLVFGGIFEVWIVFALVSAAMKKHSGRPYLGRVRDALKFLMR